MKREDLQGKEFSELNEILQQESVLFSDSLKAVESVEELMNMEIELLDEMKEYDGHLDSVEYELPEQIEMDGQTYSKNDIANQIIYFLNKSEVEFQYTLGMYQLVTLWKNKSMKTIKYKEYDSTLRCLNTVKFKGYNEWKDILAVNEYMTACHQGYSTDTAWMYFLSDKHNSIMNRIKELDPEQVPEACGPMMEQEC